MKKYAYMAVWVALGCSSCGSMDRMPVDDKATSATIELYNRLFFLMERGGVMVAHQDDLAYGHDWYNQAGRSDFRDVTGDWPAVVGWELGHLELGSEYNLDSVYFSDIRRHIIDTWNRGGITTVSWHGNNIVTGGTAWDCKESNVVCSVLPGQANHGHYLEWLDRLADFFLDLKDETGQQIPVIFRMYHEHTGTWFWWGSSQCTPDEYKSMWRMTVEYLRDRRQVHNLLYAYSPSGCSDESEYLERYPGDEFVDIVGFDIYYGKGEYALQSYRDSMASNIAIVTSYAARAGKVPVIAETGMEGVPDSTYFTNVIYPLLQGHKLSWVLFWRNAWNADMHDHFYIPYPGHKAADDFKRFVSMPGVLTNREIQLPNTNAEPTNSPFVTIIDGKFYVSGKLYNYVGTNFWYGAILGSQGEGGNRERLSQELDALQEVGIDNLRVLVGGDGVDGIVAHIQPTLQKSPGVYNNQILDGLDWLLAELGKRGMYAVLYMNNSWEWSGGYSQYLEWAGCGKAPIPTVDGWGKYMEYVKQYAFNKKAQALFSQYVRNIVTRTNRYTGFRYADDPAIMAWQIGNEPRAFSEEGKEPFARWMADIAALIKSLDGNHLVSTGSEGQEGSEKDMVLYEKVHSDPNIDYMTIHIWPFNWKWVKKHSLDEGLDVAIANTRAYIDDHLVVAERHRKPLVLEEFGFPRDNFQFKPGSPTINRDRYYEAVFSYIHDNIQSGGLFVGCNFWAWGGLASVADDRTFWQKGDDYTGDPAQEEQGLNSVFVSDISTMAVISKYSAFLTGCSVKHF